MIVLIIIVCFVRGPHVAISNMFFSFFGFRFRFLRSTHDMRVLFLFLSCLACVFVCGVSRSRLWVWRRFRSARVLFIVHVWWLSARNWDAESRCVERR
ncbi:hypothetical protein B0J12DRAFT_655986 [Macrophomina phaseolina]|uniref:Secreted peptide n=1 Tax=Macrophomina phaseolina TaxID=35725 RepID=A0ABQ8GI29_9PEZI|nr:hypothetical protein B0J12DRAFT_655986 [Macrophomina phaseolina]